MHPPRGRRSCICCGEHSLVASPEGKKGISHGDRRALRHAAAVPSRKPRRGPRSSAAAQAPRRSRVAARVISRSGVALTTSPAHEPPRHQARRSVAGWHVRDSRSSGSAQQLAARAPSAPKATAALSDSAGASRAAARSARRRQRSASVQRWRRHDFMLRPVLMLRWKGRAGARGRAQAGRSTRHSASWPARHAGTRHPCLSLSCLIRHFARECAASSTPATDDAHPRGSAEPHRPVLPQQAALSSVAGRREG
jgi:hypothetical protein